MNDKHCVIHSNTKGKQPFLPMLKLNTECVSTQDKSFDKSFQPVCDIPILSPALNSVAGIHRQSNHMTMNARQENNNPHNMKHRVNIQLQLIQGGLEDMC